MRIFASMLCIAMLAGCASKIRPPEIQAPSLGEAPRPPRSPKVVSRSTDEQHPTVISRVIEVEKCPNLDGKSLAIGAIDRVGGAAAFGLSVAGVVDAVMPALGGQVENLAKAKLESDSRAFFVDLSASLLRRGFGRVVELEHMREVGAKYAGQRLPQGLEVQAALDRLVLIGVYPRTDVLLLVEGTSEGRLDFETSLKAEADPQDVERYETESRDYRTLADEFLSKARSESEELQRKAGAELRRYREEREARTFWEKFSDVFAGNTDREPKAKRELEEIASRIEESRRQVQNSDPAPTDEAVKLAASKLSKVERSIGHVFSIRARLIDSGTSRTLSSFEVEARHPDPARARREAISELAKLVLSGTKLKTARIVETAVEIEGSSSRKPGK